MATATPAGRPRNFYETLGISSSADEAEIHAAYRRRALKTHPDKGGSAADFKEVLEAFRTLSDKRRRWHYDEQRQRIGEAAEDAERQKRKRGLLTPSELASKPQRKRLAATQRHRFSRRIAEILRKMSPLCRREVISRRLNDAQRAALEEHLLELRDQGRLGHHKPLEATIGSEPLEHKSGSGVYRVFTGSGGYFARVFVQSLGLQAHVRKDLAMALSDHAALMKVVEQIKQHMDVSLQTGSTACDRSFIVALAGKVMVCPILASVQVLVSCRHFLGHRQLQLTFKTLAEGLDAWHQVRIAHGPALFSGNGVTEDYSVEAALEQWQRVQQAYLQLAESRRGGPPRKLLEARLKRWEAQHKPARLQREALLRQRRVHIAQACCDDGSLVRSLERILRRQVSLEQGQQALSERRAPKRAQHELPSRLPRKRRAQG
jgi:hypothetical protein